LTSTALLVMCQIKEINTKVRKLKIPSNIGNLRIAESSNLRCSTNDSIVVTERTGWTEVDPVAVLVYNYRVKTRQYQAFFMIRRHRLKWPILLKYRLDPLRFTAPCAFGRTPRRCRAAFFPVQISAVRRGVNIHWALSCPLESELVTSVGELFLVAQVSMRTRTTFPLTQ